MKFAIGIAALAAGFLMALPASAQTSVVRFEVGGKNLVGSPNAKNPENFDVVNVDYSIDIPRDAATGMATGRRRHSPMTFTFKLSAVTPTLMNVISRNEMIKVQYITEVAGRIGAVGSAAGGSGGTTHTITLKNASISSFKIVDRNDDAENVDPLVRVSVSFGEIEYGTTSNGIKGPTVTDTITR